MVWELGWSIRLSMWQASYKVRLSTHSQHTCSPLGDNTRTGAILRCQLTLLLLQVLAAGLYAKIEAMDTLVAVLI